MNFLRQPEKNALLPNKTQCKSPEEEIHKFFENLQEVQNMAGDSVLVIGDFNAKVGLA